MKRTLTLKLGEKSYELLTDASEEAVLAVVNRIQNQFAQIRNDSPDASLDEILVVMLANSVLNEIRYEETISRITNRLKNFVPHKR
ncbi:cell division protein ZapA [Thermotoga caldifontis]|uniref:cell division protein ZapA n=1 Tax=Thermotoga caldifontis TaxID=1508419 RepID=UPI000597D37B|nr:cell division protein ZapA [Thermotoga caldifontis]